MAKFYRKALYRPTASPAEKLLLGARSVGHYRLRAGYKEIVCRKHFTQIFWGISGEGKITWETPSGTITEILKAGMLATYFPGDLHNLETTGQNGWEYRWWTMDGTLAAQITKQAGFHQGKVYHVGEISLSGFRAIEKNICDLTSTGEFKASASAYSLLLEAASRTHTGGMTQTVNEDFAEKVLWEIHAHWNDAQFDVNTLADHLGIHRTVLSKRFHHLFGMPPVKYITRLRIQNAISLLKRNHLPIHEIARRCGWSDANYFTRCIRQSTGSTPGSFR